MKNEMEIAHHNAMREAAVTGGPLGGLRVCRALRAACVSVLLGAAALTAEVHDARDSAFLNERRTLETARYLHDIEGDSSRARALLDRLKGSKFSAIRAQTLYLRAGFLEEAGDRREAAKLYKEALEADGLEPMQKQRLVARLLTLNPESVRPFRDAGRTRGLPTRVYESMTGAASEYVLAEEGAESGRSSQGPRLLHQDANGKLHPLPVTLGSDEEVLDASPTRILTRIAARQRVILRKAPQFKAQTVLERFTADEGHLFAGGGEDAEYLLIGAQGARVLRGATQTFSHPLPAAGCTWTSTTPRARQGVVFCPDHGVYRADFSRKLVSTVPLSGELPTAVLHSGDYLALRYADRIEFRRGPAFDTFLWGFPSSLQDAISLGRGHAFIASTDGPLRAFVLRSGQLDWQREGGAASLRARDGELFVLTHARVLLAVDERGRLLYSYETGWDGEEPLLLPSREWVVIHNADGRRIRLSRELLRITGGSRDHLLRAERESLRRGDRRGALREIDALLALEPGNGTAWRERARLLAATGGSRADQTRAWTQAARSQGAAPWSIDPAFTGLASGLGASWVWKRQPGPRFFPVLTGGRPYSFYVENDNQTLVVLDTRTGALKTSFRFPEPLDMKVTMWTPDGDTLIVSSSGRLYLMAPGRATGILAQFPLRNPVCHAVILPHGILVSDWSGNVQYIDLNTRETVWETRLGRGGTLLAHSPNTDWIDAFEVEGGWHRVRLSDGKAMAQTRMPPGTITEVHAGRDHAYAGYNEGLIVAVNKMKATIAWQLDMSEQIFSLAGRGDQFLLVGTASKRVLTIHGRTGLIQSQANVPSHLFNRPLLMGDAYWVGTAEPALEKRSLTHEVILKYPLTDMPGTPSQTGSGIAVSTQDNFILVYPAK
jgi:outer membrane protein assembly factor BamB